MFFLSCVCYAFVCVCLFVPCGHLLGKSWPLGSCWWCLTVSLSLSHWFSGPGVELDCIDSWSLHPYLLCSRTTNAVTPVGSNPRPFGLESSTLPLSHSAPSVRLCPFTCVSCQFFVWWMCSASGNIRFVWSYPLASFGHVQNFEQTSPDKDVQWMNVSCTYC